MTVKSRPASGKKRAGQGRQPPQSGAGPAVRPRNPLANVTIRRLQLLQAVARLGNYTHAAEEANIAQASAYQQIKHLEEAVGHKLMEKRGRTVEPTEVGVRMLAAARDILGRLDQLRDEIDELNQTVSGSLDVAVVTSARYFMPHYLGRFIEKYPEVRPRLRVTNRGGIINALNEHEHEIYVMGQIPEGLNVDARPFRDNIIEIVARPSHPLAKARNIPLRRLTEERFLVRERGSGTRTAIDQMLAREQLSIEPYMELGSGDAVKQGVMAGLGIAAISRHSLKLELASNVLTTLHVQGFPLRRKWYVMHRRDEQLSRAGQAFLEYLLNNTDAEW